MRDSILKYTATHGAEITWRLPFAENERLTGSMEPFEIGIVESLQSEHGHAVSQNSEFRPATYAAYHDQIIGMIQSEDG